MWDLTSLTRNGSQAPAVEAWRINRWTAREDALSSLNFMVCEPHHLVTAFTPFEVPLDGSSFSGRYLAGPICHPVGQTPWLALCSRPSFKEQASYLQFSSVQSLSRVRLFATPRIAARQASLSITNSQSSLRLTSIESVMPSSHLILCRPLLLLPPIPPSIRVFSNESTLHTRWPKYWS